MICTLLAGLACLSQISAQDSGQEHAELAASDTIYQFTMKDIDGNEVPLKKFEGKVLMVVNVAT